MPLDMEVLLGPGHLVFDGDPAPPRKRDTVPTQFLAHVYCAQTVIWINVSLGREVNLGPGDVVLDGVAASPIKAHSSRFSAHVYCGQTAGWMKTPFGTEVDISPGHTVLGGDPAPPPAKGAQQPLSRKCSYGSHDWHSRAILAAHSSELAPHL